MKTVPERLCVLRGAGLHQAEMGCGRKEQGLSTDGSPLVCPHKAHRPRHGHRTGGRQRAFHAAACPLMLSCGHHYVMDEETKAQDGPSPRRKACRVGPSVVPLQEAEAGTPLVFRSLRPAW